LKRYIPERFSIEFTLQETEYSFKDQMIWKYGRVILEFLFTQSASLAVAMGALL